MQKPEALVSENARKRNPLEEDAQRSLVDKALQEGKFGTYEFATKEEDAQDAEEANLDAPIEPDLKKMKVKAAETESNLIQLKQEEQETLQLHSTHVLRKASHRLKLGPRSQGPMNLQRSRRF